MSVGIAEANPRKERTGRLHRNYTDHQPTARRNRQRLWTACGLRLNWAFPFPLEDVPVSDRCRKCYPKEET